MGKKVIERLKAQLGERIQETHDFRGDEEVVVAPEDWHEVASFLRDDPECAMNMLTDITAVDYPEREPEMPRFDVLLFVHSLEKKHRVRVKTRLKEGGKLASLVDVWAGANWTEREAFDMFGIAFEGHPDLRRILLYPEFQGHPLRKDYPIERTQPLVAYRDVSGNEKLPPFGTEEGQPYARIDWCERLAGGNRQVSPAIGLSQDQRRALSESDADAPGRRRGVPVSEEE